jgi:hemolysin activation/secretion protein
MTTNARHFRRSLMCAAGLTGLSVGASMTSGAEAQVVERYMPPSKEGVAAPIVAPNAIPTDQDATPIGPALRSIIVLGPQDKVLTEASDGINLSAVARLKADSAKTSAVLTPYLGKPLSRKLIAEIEASIAERYRALNYPFVSLSTPAQEIGSGALQVRVVEFVAGDITTEGASVDSKALIIGKIAQKSGEPINARTLSYDISWLNRYPFRYVQAVFKPGAAPGTSDLTLQTFENKPWQVYGGYTNAGSPATGTDRYFIGGAVGLKGDRVLSYQGTGSRDAFGGKPKYISHAFTFTAPAGYHRQFEASLNKVRSNHSLSPFVVRQDTLEGTAGLRFAVSDLYNDRSMTDMRFGIEAKRQTAKTFFGGTKVYDVAMNVYQLYLGYHRNTDTALKRSDLDISLHLSPGGVGSDNDAAQVKLFSQGRLKDAKYGYLSVAYDRKVAVGQNHLWKTQIVGLVATRALPRTEQVGLGGPYLVRGYSLDDGAFDTALVVRNDLQMKSVKGGDFTVRPYIFADLGRGEDRFTHKNSNLSSAGIGSQVQIARNISLNIDAAYALKKAAVTKSGDTKINASLNFSF